MYRIKYRAKRFLVKWKKMRKRMDKRMSEGGDKLTPFEEKAIKLWRLCLKDKNTQLAFNTNNIRQLEKENLFMIFRPSGNRDHIMTIMDINSERKSVYEIHVPNNYSDDVCDYFDIELEKRMREAENNKRATIDDDLDKLIDQEEKSLNRKRDILN